MLELFHRDVQPGLLDSGIDAGRCLPLTGEISVCALCCQRQVWRRDSADGFRCRMRNKCLMHKSS